MDIRPYIRSIPDFPAPGILFRDITPLLSEPTAFAWACKRFGEAARSWGVDAVAGIESRGFVFAAPVAVELGLPLIPIRKAGKLPSATISMKYELEYGFGQLDIHADALETGQRVVVIDDLIATGGTAAAAARLVEELGASVAGFSFVIELAGLSGRGKITPYDVQALLTYD